MSFKPKTYPTLGPNSQRLIDAYNFALGSAMNPCNPSGLAAALNQILDDYEHDPHNIGRAIERIIEELES